MPNTLKAVLLDFDGTVFSGEKEAQRIVGEVFLKSQGEDVDEDELKAYIGVPMRDRFEYMLTMRGIDDDALADTLGAIATEEYHSLDTSNMLLAGVVEFMNAIKDNGLLLAIVSSSTHEAIEKKLDSIGMLDVPDLITGRDDVACRKPHPMPYAQTLEHFGITPREGIAFEDSPTGIESARLAGLPVVGILSSCHVDELLGVVDHIRDYKDMTIERLQGYID